MMKVTKVMMKVKVKIKIKVKAGGNESEQINFLLSTQKIFRAVFRVDA